MLPSTDSNREVIVWQKYHKYVVTDLYLVVLQPVNSLICLVDCANQKPLIQMKLIRMPY